MPPSDGWYLLGPFIAVALVGFLGAVFWRMGLQWTQAREDPLRDFYAGLAIFGEAEDYGLLCPAAATTLQCVVVNRAAPGGLWFAPAIPTPSADARALTSRNDTCVFRQSPSFATSL
jgi:hypothetical protein